MSFCNEAKNMDSHRTRPSLHFTANCWINDPCAPGYDPATGLYHVFYQCNPHGTEWGSMSWGHLISEDLIHWTPFTKPALIPDKPYDCDGVFTGCMVPPENSEPGSLKVIYSSVRHLPFHWSTPPYPRDAAGLAIAESRDNGKTWTKCSENSILAGEPQGIQVTGFRDPFLAEWHALNDFRGQNSMYGVVSGGIEDHGPTAFLYSVPHRNVSEWHYLSPLVNMPARFQPSQKWSGNFGINWECVNFLTLEAGSNSRVCLILGAEGDIEREHIRNYEGDAHIPPRTVRSLLWMFGDLRVENNVPRVEYTYGGYLDCGSSYAANSFFDPVSKRHIMHAWIPEEDIPASYAKDKGWNGALAIPRELFLLSASNVTRALYTPLSEISSVEHVPNQDGSATIYTLGIRPVEEIVRLRKRHRHSCQRRYISLPPPTAAASHALCSTSSTTWELDAEITINPSCCFEVGFHIRHNSDMSICTTIKFSPQEETLSINKERSTSDPNIRNCNEQGPFTLFYRTDYPGVEPKDKLESLRIRIISDADTLEVFANDWFALATMVYSPDIGAAGISAFAKGEQGSTVIEEVNIWEGLSSARRS
ncbi:hypothetical protein PENFLA_c027G03094 [Penicillium flavigenum]|uniref:Glycosyl hydrolase family 32 N-terminal domain-containing protein n=1 Tax=Penicillium flavigenum TaxID=254877 RepID=A0A1V6SS46_9EURO|nr:hypothetical protein PENFLA_c027G03094 [Penicillium flavigenum]